MTGLLTTLLHERADLVDPGPVDLEAILASGQGRVRRRRLSVGAAGLAAVAVVGIGGPLLLPGSENAPAPGIAETRSPSWADGSEIHDGDRVIDAGADVHSYVRVDGGFVATDSDGTVRLLAGGDVTEIGSTHPRWSYLVADGDLAAWTDFSTDVPEFVVYDASAGEEVLRTAEGNRPGMDAVAEGTGSALVVALDGQDVWLLSGDRLVVRDLESGEVVVHDEPAHAWTIRDVSDGMIAFRGDGDDGLLVGRDTDDAVPLRTQDGNAFLSPDGAYASVEHEDSYAVFDTATGRRVTSPIPDTTFSVGYEWLDDDRVAVLAMRGQDKSAPLDILVCSVSEDSCTTAVDAAVTFDGLGLPVGEPLG